jgi:hypothetical protein
MNSGKRISILFLIIAATLAALQISERHGGKIFMLLLALIAVAHIPALLPGYLSRWKIFSSKWVQPLVWVSISALCAVIVFRFWNFPLFDDAGFVLRYLDNFAKGHFYSFNVQDSPVFGMSSFSQGFINGILCWAHLLTPDKSIFITAVAGFIVISFVIFKILSQYNIKSELFIFSYALIVFGSKFFLNSMTTGMETPIHIAIVITAIYFFISGNSRMMWLMLSASVISKLDAVPLAVTLGAVHLFEHRKELWPLSFKNKILKELFLFVLIPVGAWIVFATYVFGSPLPQSAFAKIYLHAHADDYWFPFFKYFMKDEFRKPLFLIFLVLFAWNFRYVLLRKVSVRTLAFGLSFFSTLVLYYFYNPGERMMWYYAMPDLFLIAQTVISFKREVRLSLKPFVIYFSFLAASLLLFYDVYGGRKWVKEYLTAVEKERIYVGKYLQSITTEKDTVLASHGHIARYTPAYVIDMTGLNSKFPAEHKNNLVVVASKTNPAFAVSHGTALFIHTMDSLGYSLVKSYYDINEYYWACWRIFSRKISEDQKTRILIPDSTMADAQEVRTNFGMITCLGDSVVINLPDDTSLTEIHFGLKRADRLRSVVMSVKSGSDILQSEKLPVQGEKDYGDKASHYTQQVIFKLDSAAVNVKNKKMVLTSSIKERLKVIEPLFLLHR